MTVIESKGITWGSFYLPPFALKIEEVVILYLQGGAHFFELEAYFKSMFSKKINHENVTINIPLSPVTFIKESSVRSLLFPITVDECLKKYANNISPFSKKIYEVEWITKKTKVNTLPAKERKKLTLFIAMSHTNYIITDLAGLSTGGATEIYELIKENVNKGGAAIVLDYFDDLKNEADKFIELQMLKEI